MPRADFNERIEGVGQRGQFVQLKKKGDSITFRIADVPSYSGKHWFKDKTWVFCPKIMKTAETCDWCEKADITQDLEEKRQIKVKVSFYFPIVDRETKKAAIFQTGLQVRNAIQEYEKNGIDVYKSDWKVIRNEGDDPSRYYAVIRLDTKKLDKDEETALGEAAALDVEALTSKSFPKPGDVGAEKEDFVDEVVEAMDKEEAK